MISSYFFTIHLFSCFRSTPSTKKNNMTLLPMSMLPSLFPLMFFSIPTSFSSSLTSSSSSSLAALASSTSWEDAGVPGAKAKPSTPVLGPSEVAEPSVVILLGSSQTVALRLKDRSVSGYHQVWMIEMYSLIPKWHMRILEWNCLPIFSCFLFCVQRLVECSHQRPLWRSAGFPAGGGIRSGEAYGCA